MREVVVGKTGSSTGVVLAVVITVLKSELGSRWMQETQPTILN